MPVFLRQLQETRDAFPPILEQAERINSNIPEIIRQVEETRKIIPSVLQEVEAIRQELPGLLDKSQEIVIDAKEVSLVGGTTKKVVEAPFKLIKKGVDKVTGKEGAPAEDVE